MSYTAAPTLNLEKINITGYSFDSKGGAKTGGQNGNNISIGVDTDAGGIAVATYSCVALTPEEHNYMNWLGALLNSRTRFINVPFFTDWYGPFPVVGGRGAPFLVPETFSDGTSFSDGTLFREVAVWGSFPWDQPVGAGQVTINIFGAARELLWSDWFSVRHPTKGWRIYRHWEASSRAAVSQVIDGVTYNGEQYTLSLDRGLREAVTVGTRIEFARPRCVMKFAEDFTLPSEASGYFESRPRLEFTEAF